MGVGVEKGQRVIHVTSCSPNAIKDKNLHPDDKSSSQLQNHSRVQGKAVMRYGQTALILGRQHGLLERAQNVVRRPGFKNWILLYATYWLWCLGKSHFAELQFPQIINGRENSACFSVRVARHQMRLGPEAVHSSLFIQHPLQFSPYKRLMIQGNCDCALQTEKDYANLCFYYSEMYYVRLQELTTIPEYL